MPGVFDNIPQQPVRLNRHPREVHDHAVRVDNPDRVIPHLIGTCRRCTWLAKREQEQ